MNQKTPTEPAVNREKAQTPHMCMNEYTEYESKSHIFRTLNVRGHIATLYADKVENRIHYQKSTAEP